MSWRVVVIESQSKLDYKMGYLVVRSLDTKRILLDEIAVLMIGNPAVSLTGILMEELIVRKVKVIFCDTKRNPIAELIPHHGSHDSSAKIRVQITWEQTIKDNIWRDIVSEKIRKQADFLQEIGHEEQAMMLTEYIRGRLNWQMRQIEKGMLQKYILTRCLEWILHVVQIHRLMQH